MKLPFLYNSIAIYLQHVKDLTELKEKESGTCLRPEMFSALNPDPLSGPSNWSTWGWGTDDGQSPDSRCSWSLSDLTPCDLCPHSPTP